MWPQPSLQLGARSLSAPQSSHFGPTARPRGRSPNSSSSNGRCMAAPSSSCSKPDWLPQNADQDHQICVNAQKLTPELGRFTVLRFCAEASGGRGGWCGSGASFSSRASRSRRSCASWAYRGTIDFLLSASKDAAATKGFFRSALAQPHTVNPRTINVDKAAAYSCAVTEMKRGNELWRLSKLRRAA